MVASPNAHRITLVHRYTLTLFSNPFFPFFQMKIQSEETEEMAKFKELFPDMKSPDSLYDKSPVS